MQNSVRTLILEYNGTYSPLEGTNRKQEIFDWEQFSLFLSRYSSIQSVSIRYTWKNRDRMRDPIVESLGYRDQAQFIHLKVKRWLKRQKKELFVRVPEQYRQRIRFKMTVIIMESWRASECDRRIVLEVDGASGVILETEGVEHL